MIILFQVFLEQNLEKRHFILNSLRSYEIAINSIDSKKKTFEELIQQYNTIYVIILRLLFLEDLDKKMKKVNSDLEQLKKLHHNKLNNHDKIQRIKSCFNFKDLRQK